MPGEELDPKGLARPEPLGKSPLCMAAPEVAEPHLDGGAVGLLNQIIQARVLCKYPDLMHEVAEAAEVGEGLDPEVFVELHPHAYRVAAEHDEGVF